MGATYNDMILAASVLGEHTELAQGAKSSYKRCTDHTESIITIFDTKLKINKNPKIGLFVSEPTVLSKSQHTIAHLTTQHYSILHHLCGPEN